MAPFSLLPCADASEKGAFVFIIHSSFHCGRELHLAAIILSIISRRLLTYCPESMEEAELQTKCAASASFWSEPLQKEKGNHGALSLIPLFPSATPAFH